MPAEKMLYGSCHDPLKINGRMIGRPMCMKFVPLVIAVHSLIAMARDRGERLDPLSLSRGKSDELRFSMMGQPKGRKARQDVA